MASFGKVKGKNPLVCSLISFTLLSLVSTMLGIRFRGIDILENVCVHVLLGTLLFPSNITSIVYNSWIINKIIHNKNNSE